MVNSAHTLVTEDPNAGSEAAAPSTTNMDQCTGFHVPGNGSQPSSSTPSKIVPSNEPIMTDEQVEEL